MTYGYGRRHTDVSVGMTEHGRRHTEVATPVLCRVSSIAFSVLWLKKTFGEYL